jgi:hypothetical protein
MRSLYGVCQRRPNTGFASVVVCPVDTWMMSAPASTNACAIATDSSGVSPSSTQSVADTRTDIGFSSGHSARMALKTSSGKRSRFSSEPPYSSVR